MLSLIKERDFLHFWDSLSLQILAEAENSQLPLAVMGLKVVYYLVAARSR
jgi:hypothetical protein